MGALVDRFSKFRHTLRVVLAVKKVSMDATRQALEVEEQNLAALRLIKVMSPGYIYPNGDTVAIRIAARVARIQELKTDLMGDC